jgi:hypothetical protein
MHGCRKALGLASPGGGAASGAWVQPPPAEWQSCSVLILLAVILNVWMYSTSTRYSPRPVTCRGRQAAACELKVVWGKELCLPGWRSMPRSVLEERRVFRAAEGP